MLAALVPAASPAFAQAEKPAAYYWVSVTTNNMSIPGMSAQEMSMLGSMGNMPGAGPQRSLTLQLSAPGPQANSNATHDIPPGLNMGRTLPLLTPVRETGSSPGPYERPKPEGRMLVYWGCSESVRQGQPVVIDFANMDAAAKSLVSRAGAPQRPPGPARDRVYAEWPNETARVNVPRDSSLVGEHFVHGNYPPDIKFQVDGGHDFMAPVVFSSVSGGTAGAVSFQWDSVPTATGYFAMATGAGDKSKDIIIWTSSEVQEMGGGLLDFLPPGQVQRLIQEKVVMPTQTTRCTVPQGIFKDVQGAALQFVAYGDELNHVYPPKPADPKQRWDPIWYAKVRLKSTGMLMLGAADASERSRTGSRRPPPEARQPEARQPDADRPPSKAGPSVNPAEGVRKLKGLLGL